MTEMFFSRLITTSFIVAFLFILQSAHATEVVKVDVCVYSATPSGILTAIAVKREGRTVIIVEPGRWVGGMLGAGLKPMQDCPNYAATGGMTHDLLKTLGRFETNTEEKRPYGPKAIREDFAALLEQYEIRVAFEHRVASCDVKNGTIQSATFDLAPFDALCCPPAEPQERSSLRVDAEIFIDAGYEGNLMNRAGVSYRVGREAESEFGEPLAGVREPMVLTPIDPFIKPGDRESGLLSWVKNDHGKPIGAADEYTQAYNYRYYTTDDPEFRIALTPPENYSPAEFELVGRYVAHLAETIEDQEKLRKHLVGIFPGWKNSGEWNYQRDTLFSMSPLGISQIYADGDYADQANVWKAHQDYLRGLHAFMSNDPRVPEWYRNEVAELGLDGRIHPETGGWPHQLYIRVARRLKGRYTITSHDVYNETEIEDPVGLAQYGIDTYPARRIWIEKDGQTLVGIEGKMFVGGSRGPTNVPYRIPYRAITPQLDECKNLLVSVCFSATHLGYASARMEPVFMICGESAGIAACHALQQNVPVQKIDPVIFHNALLAANQKLNWDPAVDQSPASNPLTFAFLLNQCDEDGDNAVTETEWNAGKKSWEWLFPKIDTDGDGQLSEKEYDAFQGYKKKYADWSKRLREVQE